MKIIIDGHEWEEHIVQPISREGFRAAFVIRKEEKFKGNKRQRKKARKNRWHNMLKKSLKDFNKSLRQYFGKAAHQIGEERRREEKK